MLFKRAIIAFILILAIFAFTSLTYVYAAANTIPARKAGDGAGAINNYTVGTPLYVLDNADPRLIARVDFTLNAYAQTVEIKLVSTSTTWYSCSISGSSPWQVSCTTTGALVQNAGEFRVFATSN